ncbi:HAD family hydrolase [Alteromonas sp. 009811495]|uniref:HAD family hydrolase n=1 Tax=Alteromonas sp. 009811495 TaxID=3002962 RepID=UPI00237DD2D7|nr:beta-phosphoglucomutase family hydrolase [Alteromonas sp. 009811495]WDT86373.1 beta-phosphoglucomutase family hydrolase [Alteromonas sp. 009811495]
MIDLTSFKAIIFDMDGTLVDSMAAHIEAWQRTCEVFGYPFDNDYQYSLGGVPSLATVELMNARYNMSHSPLAVAEFKKKAYEGLNHTPTLIQDTLAVFNHYKTRMPIAVGTGSDRQHAQWVLSEHGILAQLDALVTADDVAHGKPHPETFVKAADSMNVAPHQCVVFEDTDMGKQAAIAGGMTCIMVKNGRIVR